MKRKAARFYFLAVFAFTVVFTVISPNESKAKTEIFTNGATCTITILLRKQFYTHTPVSLNQWIADLNNKIAEAQEILDRGWLGRLLWGAPTPADRNQAQDDINYYNGQINDIQSVIANCAALNAAQVQALVDSWELEIENKWSIAGYKYKCCDVLIRCAFIVRGENNPPTAGFDQIGIMPADFRSYVESENGWNFNGNGFSSAPYNNDLTGAWSANGLADYVAPHEAGHEMGLDDRYRDLPGGGVWIDPGYEHDLMGGPVIVVVNADLSLLPVISVGDNGLPVDNLATILNGRNAFCPPPCCPPDVVGGFALLPIPDPVRRAPDAGDRLSGRCEEGGKDAVLTQADATAAASEDAEEKELDESAAKEPLTDGSTASKPAEAVQYKKIKSGDVTCDAGVLYKETPAGTDIDVAALPTGKGISFRNWEIIDMKLVIDGEKILPNEKEKFYAAKKSFFRGPAAVVFTAIGSQYGGYSREAESGEVCPVTGEKKTVSEKRGAVTESIERTGMAAGLGLLTSQAKGQITGLKCSFKLDKDQAKKAREKGIIKIVLENKETQIRKTIKIYLE